MEKNNGFTLIEMLVVISVIAVLSTIALFSVSKVQASARDSQRLATMRGIQTALERYFGDNGTYPSASYFGNAIAALTIGGNIIPSNMIDPLGPTTYSIVTGSDWTITNRGVNYKYNGGITSYTLTLTREGGGSVTFKNPQ